jgi:hypothetical protein
MSKVWYGNLTNRLEEGKNYTGREIAVGDDITMYHYSDRTCYYVTAVEDQKRIQVRRYYTCADHDKPGGMGHQNWMYFRTWDEWNQYLAKYFPDHHDTSAHMEEPEAETWVFRYGKWMREWMHTEMRHPDAYTKREREHFQKHGWFKDYSDLSGKVSFGVRDYHYDWEF